MLAGDFKLDLVCLEQPLVFPGLGAAWPDLPVPMENLEAPGCLNEGEHGSGRSGGLRADRAAWEGEEGRAQQWLGLEDR